jgi:hypothetical protein
MGAGKTVKGGIELVETFLKELNKPAKAVVKAAPQDEALRLAQLRAALPPAQGGLGLPANNTPEQRARAMEFDLDKNYVHNTSLPFDKVKEDGRFSGIFALPNYSANYGNVDMPLVARGKIASSSDLRGSIKNPSKQKKRAIDEEIPSNIKDPADIADAYVEMQRRRNELARELGYTGVKINDEFGDTISLVSPENIRSRFAAFDPWRRDAATAAAFGVAAPDLMAKEQEKAMGGDVHMMGGGRPPKKTTLEENLKSFKDPAIALADLLAGALRGTTTAATGFAGDMEELYRQYGKGAIANAVRQLIPTREGKATTFPTIEEMKVMLPPVVPAGAGRSSQVADVGEFFGENNPFAPTAIAAVKPVVKAAARGALDLARSEPARKTIDRVVRATGSAPMMIVPTFPQEEALILAQKRAALPTSQYGLGLSADNTPEQRAAAMQFLDDVYHATDSADDFTALVPSTKGKMGAGVYTSPSSGYTEKYAGENARILPLLTRGKFADQDMRIDVADQALEELSKINPNFSVSEWKAITNQALKDQGYAGVDVGQERLVFDPENIRSRFAAFDPFRKDAATAAAMGVAAPDLLAEEQRKAIGGAVMMGAGGTVKKGIELVDTFLNALKEADKPAKAAKAVQPSKEVAKAAAKAVKDAEQLASAPVVQTVANPERMQYPGIYKRPDVIAAEAAARVAPESPMLKRLFGVTRNDLYEMGKGRQGNLPGTLPGLAANPKGSKVSAQIMTPQNTQRLIDVMAESEKYPALVQGMDPWYIMDPLFQKMSRELGPEKAVTEYNLMNHLFGMSSPGSEVMTEIPRGSAAYFLHKQGRFPDFDKYAGMPAHLRGEDFPQDILTVPGHAYHSTAQAGPMRKFLEKGELDMSSPKVPMYIQASGVPEVGFQTATPVGDAHWSRAVGLADVRGGSPANWKKSVSNTEMYDLGPWWREQVAAPMGLESVPAQGRTWGAFSPQTGVTTPIGAPKLELIADQTGMAANRLGISPEDALIMFINAKARLGKKEGGAVESDVDGFLDHMNKAQY